MKEQNQGLNQKEMHAVTNDGFYAVHTHAVYRETNVNKSINKPMYVVVTANSVNELMIEVEAMLNTGYLPQGGIAYSVHTGYHQAMLIASLKQ